MNSPRDDMRGRLEHLAGRVSDQWSAAQGRAQFRSALGQFGYWFAAIPLLFVLPAAFRRWRGLEPGISAPGRC
ncbi:MAG: hypothetical protein R3E96_09715 [Planctomycetota bacterium]